MESIRSMLFVPASKPTWIEKIPTYEADAIVLDLEDSVPAEKKLEARGNASEAIPNLNRSGQRIFVRINKGPHIYNVDDMEAVISPELEGLLLPKVLGPEEIDVVSAIISHIEMERGMGVGHTQLICTLETARGLVKAYDIAVKERVGSIAGASAKNADVARSVGFQWTPEGLETLYLKSQVVLAARAAGKIPLGGLWQDVHDLGGLKAAAKFNRQLGFSGEMILHPSNAPIVNEIYTPSEEEVAYFQGMIEAFEQGLKEGRAAVIYDGEHIDYAHIRTAKQIIELANKIRK